MTPLSHTSDDVDMHQWSRPRQRALTKVHAQVPHLVKQLERLTIFHALLIAINRSSPSIDEDTIFSRRKVAYGLMVCSWSGFLVYVSTILLLRRFHFLWLADISHFGSIFFKRVTFCIGRCRNLWDCFHVDFRCRWCIDPFVQLRDMPHNNLERTVASRPTIDRNTDKSNVPSSPRPTMIDRGEVVQIAAESTLREKDT